MIERAEKKVEIEDLAEQQQGAANASVEHCLRSGGLLNALHMGHPVHHFLTIAAQESMHGAAMWAGVTAAAIVGILSFVGGCLLLGRAA